MFGFNLREIILWLPAVLIAITFHEYAHAKAADNLGDPTPRYQGRLTLNPLAHLDPIGFLLLLVVHFGWAKPVQVNPLNYRGDRYKSDLLVSLAGPGMNLLIAFTAMLVEGIALPNGISGNSMAVEMLDGLIWINLFFAVFNLIPIPPLDGSHVLADLLRNEEILYRLGQYGTIILLLLVVTNIVGMVLTPIASFIYTLFGVITQGIIHLIGL